MILRVQPTSSLKGKIRLPASKSYSIRAFIIAACGGQSQVNFSSDCDDAIVAKNTAKALGARIISTKKDCYNIAAKKSKPQLSKINVKESGTTLRFLLPLASLYGTKAKIIGEGTLIGRPNKFLNETLRQMGICIEGVGEKESVPITIHGGQIKGGEVAIDGSLSSQFISALLIACANLKEDTTVLIKGKELVSVDYIEMTTQILGETGIKVKKINDRKYVIKGGQNFKGLKNFTVPSDYGLAAFLLAAAALTESKVVMNGYFNDKFVQADGHILKFVKKMGVRFNRSKDAMTMNGPFVLKGGDFSLKDCPDLVPIMAVLAMFAKGTTRLLNIRHARVKESDRISDLRKELLKAGADIEEKEDALVIHPRPVENYKTFTTLDPHHDHRLAMAFVVLGLKLGVTIKDIECTHKSYPGFVNDMKTFGAALSYIRVK